jgi:hypothetical protein
MEILFNEADPALRRRMLQDSADDMIDNAYYQEPLSEDEMDAIRKEYANESVVLADEMDAFAETVRLKRLEFKQKNELLKMMRVVLKFKKRDAKGTLYHLKDWDNRMLKVVDSNGKVIEERRMDPKEMQLNFKLQVNQ